MLPIAFGSGSWFRGQRQGEAAPVRALPGGGASPAGSVFPSPRRVGSRTDHETAEPVVATVGGVVVAQAGPRLLIDARAQVCLDPEAAALALTGVASHTTPGAALGLVAGDPVVTQGNGRG